MLALQATSVGHLLYPLQPSSTPTCAVRDVSRQSRRPTNSEGNPIRALHTVTHVLGSSLFGFTLVFLRLIACYIPHYGSLVAAFQSCNWIPALLYHHKLSDRVLHSMPCSLWGRSDCNKLSLLDLEVVSGVISDAKEEKQAQEVLGCIMEKGYRYSSL